MTTMTYEVRDTNRQEHHFNNIIDAMTFRNNFHSGVYIAMYKDGLYYGIMWADGRITLDEDELKLQTKQAREVRNRNRARERRLAQRIAMQV